MIASSHRKLHRIAGAVAFIATSVAISLLGPEASAQPNPFEDYERWKSGDNGGPGPSQGREQKDAAVASPGAIHIPTAQFDWALGARSQFSYTGSSNELLTGGDASANTFFFRISPALALFLYERVQVGLSVGYLSRSASNEASDASEGDLMIEATGSYVYPLTERFAVIPTIGLGGYLGSGTRSQSSVNSRGVTTTQEVSVSTGGFAAALSLGVGYQMFEHVQLRSGVALNALVGSESTEGGGSMSTSTAHIGLPVELFYTF